MQKEVKALQQAYRPQEKVIEPTIVDTPVKVDKTIVPIDKDRESSTLGKKIGKTSKYHFVNVARLGRNGEYKGFRASTSKNGKSVNMGSHKDEIQCALLADAYLDKIGDGKRPRNRDDFPEVKEAYLAAKATAVADTVETKTKSGW